MDPTNTVSQVPSVPSVLPEPPSEPASQPVQTPPSPVQVPPTANKTSLLFKFALVALSLSLVAAGIYLVWTKIIPRVTQKACTMDAKICPDGSSVGRVAPSCDFAPCPVSSPSATPDPTANWKTYTNDQLGFSLKYPQEWSMTTNQINLPGECYSETGGPICNSGYLNFSVGSKSENQSLLDYLVSKPDKYENALDGPKLYESDTNQAKLSKLNATIIDYSGMWSDKDIYIPINDLKYLKIDTFQVSHDELDQILSTFRFLEATPSATPQL